MGAGGRPAAGIGSAPGGLDPALERFLDGLHRRGVAHDADRDDRLERLRNLEPETARHLWVLARAAGARDVLEVGTSNGYGTVWLADAVGPRGTVVSVDVEPGRSAEAAENLRSAGRADRVRLRTEDAAATLRDAPDAAWDLVLLDAERPAYPDYWPDLRRTLRPGGLLAVDNVLSHPDEVAPFLALVDAAPGVTATVVPVGAGLLLAVV
jgi:predicted O-methyltransferase YrrM